MEGFLFASGGARTRPSRPADFPRRLRGAIGALVERDLLGLVRSPTELGRAAFLAFLLVLYTSFIFVAPLREAGARPEAVARLLLLNVVAAGYFLTAFGLRFVFPSLSREGRTAWVFFSCPIRIFRVLLARLLLHVLLLTVAVVPIAMAGTLRLVRDPAVVGITAALLILLAVTTTAVVFAFGTGWPNFRESNPEFLATSGSGLAATLVCLVYVALTGWIARRAALAAAGGGALGWLLAAVSISAVLTGASLALAYRRTRTLEVA